MRNRKILFILALILIAAFAGRAFAATYTYDNENHLISVDYGDGNFAIYTYDGPGNRTGMFVYSCVGCAVRTIK